MSRHCWMMVRMQQWANMAEKHRSAPDSSCSKRVSSIYPSTFWRASQQTLEGQGLLDVSRNLQNLCCIFSLFQCSHLFQGKQMQPIHMEYDDQIDITCIQRRKCCEVTATKKDTSGDLHAYWICLISYHLNINDVTMPILRLQQSWIKSSRQLSPTARLSRSCTKLRPGSSTCFFKQMTK